MAAAHATPPIAHAIGGSIGSALALFLFYPLERARIELQAQVASGQPGCDNAINNEQLDSVEVQVDLTASGQPRVVVVGADGNPSLPTPASESSSWMPLPGQGTEDLTPSWSTETSENSSNTSTNTNTRKPVAKNDRVGLVTCLLQLQERGALYQGLAPVLTTIFTSQFVFFYMHAYMKLMLKNSGFKRTQSGALLSLISSCLAGICNVLVTNPLWVVNMAIVTGEATSSNLWRELFTMIQTHGWWHMWNGTSASILLVSNPVIQFFCYEQMKQSRLAAEPLEKASKLVLPAMEAFFLGAMAKAVATVMTYPLQLTQTVLRLQDNGYKGTLDCLIGMYIRGGVEEWYTGMRAKLLQTVLTAAFTFLTYEQILGAVQVALAKSNRIP